jgi:hypothetical protein
MKVKGVHFLNKAPRFEDTEGREVRFSYSGKQMSGQDHAVTALPPI